MNAQERYEYWLNSPDVDEGTKAELRAIAGDPVEIEDRFYQELSFGTAGLRGVHSSPLAATTLWLRMVITTDRNRNINFLLMKMSGGDAVYHRRF